jgi:RNA polymerase sigma factor (sigma-70 family)
MGEAFGHQAISDAEAREPRVAEVASVESLSALYHDGYHRFVRVAEAITGSVDDAHDAVQEAFANALRQPERYEARGSLEGWMWRCVVNAARMSRRRSRRVVPLVDVREVADSIASRPEQSPRLLAQLVRLPERQRLVLFLRYFADLPYEAIADALQISPGTVAASLNAAHRNLRHWLEEVQE